MKKPATVPPNNARVGFLVMKETVSYCIDANGNYQGECYRLTGGNKGIGYIRYDGAWGNPSWHHGSAAPALKEQQQNFDFYPDLLTAIANLPASMTDAQRAAFGAYRDKPGIVVGPAAPRPPQTDWSKIDLKALIEERWATKKPWTAIADKYGLSVLTLRSKVEAIQCSDGWFKLMNEWRNSPDDFDQKEWASVKDTWQGQLIQKYLP